MAAITAALIGGTAVSALSAGTIAAGISGLTAAAGAGMSFAQAGQAKGKAADATRAADKAIAEAKSKLDLNFYDTLGIQKEPYELQREALLASGAQALEAGRESERGAAATAGRVMMAQNEAQAGVRTAMGQDLMALEKLSAAEDSRLRDVGAQISMEEAAGAQLARANFEELAGRATTQGLQGIVNAGGSMAQSLPLYMKDANAAAKAAADAAAAQGLNLNGTLTGAQIQKNAQSAFAPQLKAMMPPAQGVNNSLLMQRNMLFEKNRAPQFDYNNQGYALNPFAVYQG
jgi:hypothetical protein